MADPLKEINQKLDRIQVLLAGDSDYKTEGLVAKVDNHEERLDELEKNSFWKTLRTAGIGAAIGGAFGTLFPKAVLAKIIGIFT